MLRNRCHGNGFGILEQYKWTLKPQIGHVNISYTFKITLHYSKKCQKNEIITHKCIYDDLFTQFHNFVKNNKK